MGSCYAIAAKKQGTRSFTSAKAAWHYIAKLKLLGIPVTAMACHMSSIDSLARLIQPYHDSPRKLLKHAKSVLRSGKHWSPPT